MDKYKVGVIEFVKAMKEVLSVDSMLIWCTTAPISQEIRNKGLILPQVSQILYVYTPLIVRNVI